MKSFKNRQYVAGLLFMVMVIAIPLIMNLSSESSKAFEIYALYEENKNLTATGIGFGALYGAGAAIGIICGVQLAVGLIAVA